MLFWSELGSFSCLNVHLVFSRDDTQALYYFYPNILDWSPFSSPTTLEWTCMCLPFQASHLRAVTHRPPPIRNVSVISWQWQWGEFTNKKQKQWRYAIISHESITEQHYSIESFSKNVCPDIFVLKVTKLWVWAHCCVYVAYIAGGE